MRALFVLEIYWIRPEQDQMWIRGGNNLENKCSCQSKTWMVFRLLQPWIPFWQMQQKEHFYRKIFYDKKYSRKERPFDESAKILSNRNKNLKSISCRRLFRSISNSGCDEEENFLQEWATDVRWQTKSNQSFLIKAVQLRNDLSTAAIWHCS